MKAFLMISLGLTVLCCANSYAQQPVSAAAPETDIRSIAKSTTEKLTAQVNTPVNKVQLQATIRASKEQPKVLTIVPWQLPQYNPVVGHSPSVATLPQLSPLFRKSFVQEQKVYLKLFKSNSNP